ncbi:MAG: DUF362 domain-containing protein [Candidatus Thermoplasmatota archaeon]|nr:DUF362 domain-containing protein [Candidatus Thermoplasmatota archaeon]
MKKSCKKKHLERIKNLRGLWFHIVGIACLIWFLIRVVPAPHRSQYPCQQISIPIALGYVAFWGVLFSGLFAWIKKVRFKTAAVVPTILAIFVIAFTISGMVFAGNYLDISYESDPWDPIPNDPIGTPVGINPGRVAWVWNPDATEGNLNGFWWKEQNNNQTVIEQMYSKGLQELTGESDDHTAWNTLFKHFNLKRGHGEVGYQTGEKIAIKINMNNCWNPIGAIDDYVKKDNERDASPYVVKALLKQLVNTVGINQQNITVYDASRVIPNWFYDRVATDFPDVHYVDAAGGASGREKVQPSSEKIYFVDGTIRTLPCCVIDADYLINMPELKRHPIKNGVTLSGKNMFGTFIEPVLDLHPYLISGQNMGNPAPQTDLFAHKQIGGKTLLFIGDGTYGTLQDHRTISKFDMYPFNDDWTNSLFFSQDPVAIDSVMYDFLHAEGPCPAEGSQNYLHQTAEPPINIYDPENDGEFLSESLGVHEHWDTNISIFSADRYSGPDNNGIDFVAIGEKYAHSSVVITQPGEHKVYLNGAEKSFKILWKDIYSIPVTLVVGNITVKAQVNNLVEEIDQMKFYLDGELQDMDERAPYEWEWDQPSFSRHLLNITASVGGEEILRAQRIVWKFL